MLPILRKYDIDITSYSQTQQVKSNCNSIQFVNLGTSTVTINQNITLITNQTFTIEGNDNEICVGIFLLTFDNLGTNNCSVIKKNFV
jgi:hypothetical protein